MSRSPKSSAHLWRALVTGYRPTSNWLPEHLRFSLQKHLKIYCRNRSQVQLEWLFPPYRDLPYEASAPGSWFSDEHISFFIAIFYFLLCLWIKEKDTHLPEVLKTSVLSVFLALFACWCETHIPRKVPESENFYEILRSRTFVKFRINTGFTASCFFGTLLIVFAEIKDFYEFTRCRQHTTSTCTVSQNWSTAVIFSTRYPASCIISRSRARLVILQEIYTILSTP